MTTFSSRDFYASVSTALAQLDSDVDAAECHGVLCGMLCSPDAFETQLWLQHLTGYPDSEPTRLAVDHVLSDLLRSTLRGMDSEDFGFELLLPDDDEPLVIRTDALGGWCRGFLSGFGTSRGAAATSTESQEFLGDLYRISQVDPQEADGEVGESAFQEIVEYARMGAILLREENRQVMADVFDHGSLH
jgi:yecA family protein